MTEKVPEMDQDGKMINPHNPDFITKVPWYLGSSGPTLKHHSIQKNDHVLTLSESDALIASKIAAQKESAKTSSKTVYKKGACKNCGATTHKEKDCVERPRSAKKAAWKSGLDIAPDEVALNLENFGKVNYSTKRDQYKGYNPAEYQEVIDKHERMELERKKLRAEAKELKRKQEEEQRRAAKADKKKNAAATASSKSERRQAAAAAAAAGGGNSADEKPSDNSSGSDSDSDSDYGSDEERDSDGDGEGADFIARDEEARTFQNTMAPQGGLGGAGMRMTSRDLRLREDRPKYLLNLALDSAFYDPKSRSMRDNPLPDVNPEDLQFAGDNFIRHTGDAKKLAENMVLCWEMQARGESMDVISNPSQAELVQRQFVDKKKDLESSKRRAILEKYGDSSSGSTATLDPRLRLGQTETYVEYSKDGRVIKGAAMAKPVVRTKYEEDVLVNNHLCVWGSYFNRARSAWGYRCCHSLLRNSYCTGEKGCAANDAANGQGGIDAFQARKMLATKKEASSSSSSGDKKSSVTNRSDLYGDGGGTGSGGVQLDEARLKEAHRRAEEFDKRDHGATADDRKRGYNSFSSAGGEVTAEDMEVYRLKKSKGEDPMARFMDGGDDGEV